MSPLPPFANEPVLELRRASVRAQLADALARIDRELPLAVPVLIGGDARDGEEIVSTDPGRPDRVIARSAAATEAETAAAVATAGTGFPEWSRRPAAARAETLLRAAAWMRERRLELAALEVRECAKPWPEADADVCEAIDFLEYYAREAIALDRGAEVLQVPGERNQMRYAARGVAAVIAPWNFPLAIPCGMTAAALVTGNTVVFKPAEQSPACGLKVAEALLAGGVPERALSLLPGEGPVGAALVTHPRVTTLAFTGSLGVGLEIIRSAAEVRPGQLAIKRVIAELGGKNCVVVDADADLDDAVPAIVSSAFVYAGQKCSAAARVIERSAQERVSHYAELAEAQGVIAARVDSLPPAGWFCPPTVAVDLAADSPVLADEIFGPLLAIERVRDVEHAMDIVEGLPVALTGGLFARDPATVRYVEQRSPVGNLYVNRGITGAKVGRQPFGGNRLSGNGTKAGGPDYLRHFVEPRAVTENTVRHGLVV
jgi:acyl-CoA reductase-like NAD-dependent aldehyde dehydrogenase